MFAADRYSALTLQSTCTTGAVPAAAPDVAAAHRLSCRPAFLMVPEQDIAKYDVLNPLLQVHFLREQLAWLPQTPGELPPFLAEYADKIAAAGGSRFEEVVID